MTSFRGSAESLALGWPWTWRARSLPAGLQALIVVVALAANGLAVWRILVDHPDGFGSAGLELVLCALDVAMWAVIARAPRWGWLPMAALVGVMVGAGAPPGTYLLELLVAVVIVAYAAAWVGLFATLAIVVGWTIAAPVFDNELGLVFVSGFLIMVVIALAFGVSLRVQAMARERDRQVMADFESSVRERLKEERAELARELHDIVAHDLTIIAMQSSAGSMQTSDAKQREKFEVLGESARGALGDLRRLLRVMRRAPSVDEEVATSPTSVDLGAELDDLATSLRTLGHRVTAEIAGDLEDIPIGVRTTVSRVLREGTTNVLKHAGARTDVELFLTVEETQVRVGVINTRGTRAPGSASQAFVTSSFGLTGLRERVDLLGGSLVAGATPSGEWRLVAELPWHGGR